jgi:hypothetical protein
MGHGSTQRVGAHCVAGLLDQCGKAGLRTNKSILFLKKRVQIDGSLLNPSLQTLRPVHLQHHGYMWLRFAPNYGL